MDIIAAVAVALDGRARSLLRPHDDAVRHLREQQRAEPPQLRVAQLPELQGFLQGRFAHFKTIHL